MIVLHQQLIDRMNAMLPPRYRLEVSEVYDPKGRKRRKG